MNPSERLERIIDSNSKSLTDFANKYGYNKSTLHNYIKGRDMDSKFIISLKENLNVNPTWLLTGEGEMFLNPPLSPFAKGGNRNKPDFEVFLLNEKDFTFTKPPFAKGHNLTHK